MSGAPRADRRDGAADARDPAADARDPAADARDPAADARDPAADGPVDLRLVPAAVAAWAGALVVVLADRWVAALVAGLAVAVAAAAVTTRASTGGAARRPGRAAGDRVGAALVLAATALTTVLVTGSTIVWCRSGGLLGEVVTEGATATVRGVVVGRPGALPARWSGDVDRVRFVVEVTSLDARGRTGAARATLVVLAPGDPPEVGSTVQVTGRVRAGPRTDRELGALTSSQPPAVLAGPSGVAAWHARLARATDEVAARIPGDAGALLLGVALGDTSRVDDDLTAALRAAGLTHLTAVSGAHFAILGTAVLGLAGLLRSGRRSRAAALVASGAALFWLVGGEPSVVRAAAMGTIGVGGLLVGRPSRAPAALATAVVVLLAADPWLAVELGFVLSVLATAAIVLLARAWVQRWSPALGQEAAAGLAVPLAAQLACAPVLLVAGPGVGPYAVLANVAVAPAVAPATVLGVLAAALAPVAPAAALPLAHVAGAACWWIAAVAHAVAGAPGAQVTWAAGPVGIAALAAVGASMAGLLLRVRPDPARRSRRR